MSWPRALGRVPTLQDINLLCWLLFASIAAPLFVAHSGPEQVRVADFVQLYSTGRILNEYPAEDLYNYQLQQKLSGELRPLKEGFYGPSPYPPYVAILLRPLAHMPYLGAYVLWMAISLALFLGGLRILTRRFFAGDPLRRSLIFCFSLAYYPFIVGTLINGQLAAVAFFSLALAMEEDDRDRPVVSGLALSLCAYKPTLLVFILPMLLVTRRFKTLAGFGIGTLAFVVFATAVEGVRVWSGYLAMLLDLTRIHALLPLRVYIDVRAFTSLLSPTHSWIVLAPVFAGAGWVILCLVRIWRASISAGKTATTLVWATTTTWTLLLNIYIPMYDSILVILSTITTARIMKNFAGKWFGILCVLIFASAWVTVEIAERTGIQVLTLLLATLGILQLCACRREIALSTQARELSISSRLEQAEAEPEAGFEAAVTS